MAKVLKAFRLALNIRPHGKCNWGWVNYIEF
jgi:hypothetical protein